MPIEFNQTDRSPNFVGIFDLENESEIDSLNEIKNIVRYFNKSLKESNYNTQYYVKLRGIPEGSGGFVSVQEAKKVLAYINKR